MCRPASFIVTKDRVFWSRKTESHTDIIEEHGLHADGVRGPNIAKVEITPPGNDYRAPLDQWAFTLDEHVKPQWLDLADAESMTRAALPEWLAAKVVLPEQSVEIRDRQIVAAYGRVTAYDSATVTAYGSATVTACDSATVTACDSATVKACGSATVTACGSATVTAYGSATGTA
jgi:hypothetical protein